MAKIKALPEKEKNDWIRDGSILFPCYGKVSITDTVEPGIYKVVPSPNPMDNRVGIQKVNDKFDLGLKKIYETGGEEIMEKIKTTWDSYIYQEKLRNLCVIFSGVKGTGKTISAKILCNEYAERYPVLIVDSSFGGAIVNFLQQIDFKCVVFIDEAEKIFSDSDKIHLLKICDGSYISASKLVLMTMNNLYVDNNLISRPGRVRYIKEFKDLPKNTCMAIIKDNLKFPERAEEIYDLVNTLENVTIDIVQSIIEEVNIYGDLVSVLKYMNIKRIPYEMRLTIFPSTTPEEEDDIKMVTKILMDKGETDFNYIWRDDNPQYKKEGDKSTIGRILNKYDNDSVHGFLYDMGSTYNFNCSVKSAHKDTVLPGFGVVIDEPDEYGFCHVRLDFSTGDQEAGIRADDRGYGIDANAFINMLNDEEKKAGDIVYCNIQIKKPVAYYNYYAY